MLSISSINTVIDVKRSNAKKTKIELLEGYNFNISIDRSILFNNKKIIKNNANCYVIDGMIESLSEIHHLLTQAAENKEPYVIFLRNMSPEVRNVIFVQRIRSLISEKIKIEVGLDLIRKDVSALAKIDKFFRIMRAVVSFGGFRCGKIEECTENPFDKSMIELLNQSDKLYPSASICYGVISASSILESIISIGISIVDDS